MKEPYIEGVATHDGPESCAGTRKDAGESEWNCQRNEVRLLTSTILAALHCKTGALNRVEQAPLQFLRKILANRAHFMDRIYCLATFAVKE